ncbi:MAG: MipA/OmpV family protein [Pseudomonadales bacterium]
MTKNCLLALRPIPLARTAAALLLSTLAILASPARADDDDRSWQFNVALGYGQRSNPLVDGDDIDIYWLVDLAWYGERWFFDNGDIGFTIYEGEHFSLNAIGSLNSDRVFFSHLNDGFLGVQVVNQSGFTGEGQSAAEDVFSREELAALIDSPDRDYAFEMGFEFLSNGNWGFLQAQFNSDVSSVHNGHEFWLTYGYDWFLGRWHAQPSIGVSWKSAEFNNYYFGVREEESIPFLLPPYRTGSGVNYSGKLALSYLLTENWKFVMMAEREKLNDGATDSPFIFEDSITTYFAGVYYRF